MLKMNANVPLHMRKILNTMYRSVGISNDYSQTKNHDNTCLHTLFWLAKSASNTDTHLSIEFRHNTPNSLDRRPQVSH